MNQKCRPERLFLGIGHYAKPSHSVPDQYSISMPMLFMSTVCLCYMNTTLFQEKNKISFLSAVLPDDLTWGADAMNPAFKKYGEGLTVSLEHTTGCLTFELVKNFMPMSCKKHILVLAITIL